MNLVYNLLDEPYELRYGEIYNITVENLSEFRKIVDGLYTKDYIFLYNDDEVVNDYKYIENLFNFDFNDKKIVNKILKDLLILSRSEILYENYIQVNLELRHFISDLIFEYDIALDVNDECDFSQIIKAFGLRVSFEGDTFIEKIINYIELNQEIFNIDIFIFMNLTQFLDDNDIIFLKDFLEKKRILLINYDKIYTGSKVLDNQILFDNDLCRII